MNNMKNNLALVASLFILNGCDFILKDMDDGSSQNTPQPEWVSQILSSSENLNSLIGVWSYSSATLFEDSSCELNPKIFDIEGAIVYSENTATRTLTMVYPFSDYEEENYTLDMFQSDCLSKGGTILTETDCQITDSYELDYNLTPDGYCEVYTKDDSTITYCGNIEFSDMYVDFTFTWNTEQGNWNESGCKIFSITWQPLLQSSG